MAGLKLYLFSSRAACFLLLCVHHATAISFNYDNSFSSDDFREEDDASITDGRIELLGDEANARARGRVLYKQAVQLWDGVTGEAASFTASFNFSIQSLPGRSSTPGHGMTFFIAPYMPQLPQESYDGCLGLFDERHAPKDGTTAISTNASGSASFVAVEFDTHRDAWDPSSRHIGVDVNNVDSRGNFEILPEGSLVDAGVMSSTVNYDNATARLDVDLRVIGTGTRYTLSATVDLRSLLPEHVAVGFSAATGDAFVSYHTLLSCSFKSTLPTRNDDTPFPSTSSTKKVTLQLSAGVGATAVLVLLLAVTVAVLLRRASRRNRQEPEVDNVGANLVTRSVHVSYIFSCF